MQSAAGASGLSFKAPCTRQIVQSGRFSLTKETVGREVLCCSGTAEEFGRLLSQRWLSGESITEIWMNGKCRFLVEGNGVVRSITTPVHWTLHSCQLGLLGCLTLNQKRSAVPRCVGLCCNYVASGPLVPWSSRRRKEGKKEKRAQVWHRLARNMIEFPWDTFTKWQQSSNHEWTCVFHPVWRESWVRTWLSKRLFYSTCWKRRFSSRLAILSNYVCKYVVHKIPGPHY